LARTLFRGKTKLVRASTHPTVVFRNRNYSGYAQHACMDVDINSSCESDLSLKFVELLFL
ncbi:MAG: hypothetical protein JW959_05890, partial [Pirellulales bacterium]|nr:hypothetical protein [Pirellulales bacterium]